MRVMAMIDSLIAAGAERMAVNIANGLAEAGIESHLCATRGGGPLEEFISPEVKFYQAHKRHFLDLPSFIKLRKYVRNNKIDIIHAHSSSLFWACLLKISCREVRLVWHDHFGFSENLDFRFSPPLKMASRFTDHIFVVNDKLFTYAVNKLKVDKSKLSFLANFGDLKEEANGKTSIPDPESKPKLVCLANLRRQKDHDNLLDAFTLIVKKRAMARLYLVGGHFNDAYYKHIKTRVDNEDALDGRVFILGSRNDVSQILRSCDVGVLSSLSEGLPVSLLEYGMTELPVVCTDVGDSSFVLDRGRCGELVPAADSTALAEAILKVLANREEARTKAEAFKKRVGEYFSKDEAIRKILTVYNSINGKKKV